MKKLILTATILLTVILANAQSKSYDYEMEKSIKILDTVKTKDEYLATINKFKNIALSNGMVTEILYCLLQFSIRN